MEIDVPAPAPSPPPTYTHVMPAVNSNELADYNPQQIKRNTRKTSIVWKYFTKKNISPGITKAVCNQCNKQYAYISSSKQAGTSHLMRHITSGGCQKVKEANANTGSGTGPPKKRQRAGFSGIPFDQERCSEELAKMIIIDELPLEIVEHSAFIDFVRTLQPHFNMVDLNTIQGGCVAVYLREKQNLLNLMSSLSGRVNLILDLWTSNSTMGYVFITAQFIDDEWNLNRWILNVTKISNPDSDFAFNQAVLNCLSDWHLENKLFTLTLGHSLQNDNVVENLRGLLSVKNSNLLYGQLLNEECYARLITRLVMDALSSMEETVTKIGESVKYVKTSDNHQEKFMELKLQLRVPSTRELIIDDKRKWNTTYHMLVAACELKEVFTCFDTRDLGYKIHISIDDWKKIETLCFYLKLFYDAANILTTSQAAHMTYPEVLKLEKELADGSTNSDPVVSGLATRLKAIFDKYWKVHVLVLAMAAVMDPRYKMKIVEFNFTQHVEDSQKWIKTVNDALHEIFLDYPLRTGQFYEHVPDHLDGVMQEFDEVESSNIQNGVSLEENHHYATEEGNLHQDGIPVEVKLENKGNLLQGSNGQYEEATLSHNPQDYTHTEIFPENGTHIDEIAYDDPPPEGFSMEIDTSQSYDEQGHVELTHVEEHHHHHHHHNQEDIHLMSIGNDLAEFDVYLSGMPSKSELDQYLEEPNLPREELDVLAWWNINQQKYPTLSKMAADILSIPFSTVDPGSVFDTNQSMTMNSYRSSLRPVILEALICAKDWLRHSSSSSSLFSWVPNEIVQIK